MAVVQQAIASINRPNNTGVTVTGGSTATLGIYTVRTFTATDTLVVSGGSLSCDYLVVGGGGAGGTGQFPNNPAGYGGGGEGGQVAAGTVVIAAGTYTVTIGGSNQDSSIGALVTGLKGNNGGDGTTTAGAGGTGNPGSDGGAGCTIQGIANAGPGVDGVQSAINGTLTRYGGGGGGGGQYASGTDRVRGLGGLGGGGNGASVNGPVNPQNGTANTGGGGGGGYDTTVGLGGTGIVILRYVTP